MRFRDLVEELVHKMDEDAELGTSAEVILSFPAGIKLSDRLVEGQWKKYNNDHDVRLDKRPSDQGGNQLHIRKRDGSEWAYRQNGVRSEPRKYTLQATRAVQDIVRDVFSLSPDHVIEVNMIGANRQHCLLEVTL